MARSPSAFRQTDVTRALNAARAAGYNAARILIGTDGRIDVTTRWKVRPQADTRRRWFEAHHVLTTMPLSPSM